ncbi:MAG: phosphate acyltransferase PlsX [Eubacteriales bacterium]
MNIILDAFGGDNAPKAIVEGAVQAVNAYSDIKVILTGKEELIKEELALYNYDRSKIQVVNATQVIDMAESPVEAIKRKNDSSLVVGFNLLKEGKGQAFITAGSTGATVAGATLIVRRIKGVKRPALAPVMPTTKGTGVLLIDCGANVDCKPSYLAQFAQMGSIYMSKAQGVLNPRVGLLNNGAEEEKGNMLTKEAYAILKGMPLNFVGNVEARNVNSGDYDVVACDGFAGNIALKMMEGAAQTITSMLKEELYKNFKSKIGALLAKGAFRRLKKRMDYTEYGGALLLGVNGCVIKAHGSSNARAIKSAVNQAREFIIGDLVNIIKEEITKVED